MERIVCCIVALFVVCYAQQPEPCQSPKQWEGRMVLFDASKEFTEKSRIIYDELGMRERVIEEIEYGKERDYYDTLTLYREMKEYRVNLRTKKCNVTTVNHPFRVKGVPAGAKFLFEGVIGASNIQYEHFTAVTFGGEYTTDHVRYATTVTFPDCVPIADNYYNDVTKYVESRYFDIHAGITDPMAFIPPTECM
ncbi:mammalian ependymin-related protein 1-like [Mercenaria mercenaria]|uniref:mammalian ependymin-related protein 1-like n=1 Tax=Mercenaria mercenaria TaxID=6596 RepID=UPI001E1DC176|nr:mammalian ependymin-related protein 1-like [Mercenaria mercenaria]